LEEWLVDLRRSLGVLGRHWRLILLITLLSVGASGVITLQATPQYRSSVKFFVTTAAAPEEGLGLVQGSRFSQDRIISYADLLVGPLAAKAVQDDLDLGLDVSQIRARVVANPIRNSVLLEASVTDSSPERAQQIARSLGATFPQLVETLERPPDGGASSIRLAVVEPPELPSSPVAPQPALNLLAALGLGLLLGIGVSVLREALDTSIKTAADLEGLLDVPVLGVVNFDPNASRRPLIVQDQPQSSRAEAFRQLRTNLQFIDIDVHPRSIVVTSSLAQEGKSTTACNLAISLSQAGMRVALVEADLRRPRLATYLGLEGAVGLTSVLIGQVSLAEALQPWGPDGRLLVLPSGATPPNPAELLGSKGMANLVDQLEGMADLVLVDAPPLLPVTDAAVLSRVTSGALLIVRSNRTRRDQVTRAAQQLEAVDGKLLGSVLTMVPSRKGAGADYGYGYKYTYTSAASETTGARRERGRRTPAPATPAIVPGGSLTAGGTTAPAAPPRGAADASVEPWSAATAAQRR
jgi:non-specific protein-tyrosine kinase